MHINDTYPSVGKRMIQRRRLLHILRWPMIVAAYICVIVNIMTGGKAWSIIVLMGEYMTWRLLLSPVLVEYNRISQVVRWTLSIVILLILINGFLAPGWAALVVPIVCTVALVLVSLLLFTDFERQKHNLLPLLFAIVCALVGAIVGMSLWYAKYGWLYAVMGSCALALLVACIAALRTEFLLELKKRFHMR